MADTYQILPNGMENTCTTGAARGIPPGDNKPFSFCPVSSVTLLQSRLRRTGKAASLNTEYIAGKQV